MSDKPLGHKSYGSIPHLPSSRLGPGDHKCHKGQAYIATQEPRDSRDRIIVTEKLDGSNVSVALKNGKILPLTRSGHLAITSPYEQHRLFYEWALWNEDCFRSVLREGERLCGEWLMQAHSIRYDLLSTICKRSIAPFFVFDLMTGHSRAPWEEVVGRAAPTFHVVPVVGNGDPISPDTAKCKMRRLTDRLNALRGEEFYDPCGALEPVEGFVWRVERDGQFDFMAKWVRPDKVDGKYLGDHKTVWNITPEQLREGCRAK